MHTHAPQDVIHNMLCLHEFRNQAMQNSRITSPTQPQLNNPQIVPTRCRTPVIRRFNSILSSSAPRILDTATCSSFDLGSLSLMRFRELPESSLNVDPLAY